MDIFEDLKTVPFDALGEPFIIQKNNAIFSGIFEKEYVDTNEISGFKPVITCATEDAQLLSRGDIIERGNELYTFILQEPDGTGISRVILENA